MATDHRGIELAGNYSPLSEAQARQVAGALSGGDPNSALYVFASRGHSYNFDQIIHELGQTVNHPDAGHDMKQTVNRLHNYLFAHYAASRVKPVEEEDES